MGEPARIEGLDSALASGARPLAPQQTDGATHSANVLPFFREEQNDAPAGEAITNTVDHLRDHRVREMRFLAGELAVLRPFGEEATEMREEISGRMNVLARQVYHPPDGVELPTELN